MRYSDESLPESFRSVKLDKLRGVFPRLLTFMGPAFLVSVGYMDPGNWATDLEAGARYGYRLLWVVLLSSLMAIFLQILCVRVGLVTGRDLAQLCRDQFRKPYAMALWILAELAIIACDLAEVIGSAIALQLLFHIPLVIGVLITTLDVLLLLSFTKLGFRRLESIILTLVTTIFACFAFQMVVSKPDLALAVRGMVIPTIPDSQALLILVGIIGATVMPHNLYLHSSIVQTRAFERTKLGILEAIRSNTFDTIVALGFAFSVNAALLILAGTILDGRVELIHDLGNVYHVLTPLLGGAAATAFALALLAAGQSSTITGTLAGQIVMEGFLGWKISPAKRRIVTRMIAVVPALVLVLMFGGEGTTRMLVYSQVLLSLQLPFAVVPLILFTTNRKLMGEYANPLWVVVISVVIASIIIGLNVYLLFKTIGLMGLFALLVIGAIVAFSLRFIKPKEKIAAQ